jgi:hypothetical protein
MNCDKLATGAPRGESWKDRSDHWRVTILADGKSIDIDYWTGIGLRPRVPDLRDVLCTLASDCQTEIELPRDTGDALDVLMTEYGCERASDALTMLHALGANRGKIETMLADSGVSLDEFMEWAISLDQ